MVNVFISMQVFVIKSSKIPILIMQRCFVPDSLHLLFNLSI